MWKNDIQLKNRTQTDSVYRFTELNIKNMPLSYAEQNSELGNYTFQVSAYEMTFLVTMSREDSDLRLYTYYSYCCIDETYVNPAN